jgi:hypothetical protein
MALTGGVGRFRQQRTSDTKHAILTSKLYPGARGMSRRLPLLCQIQKRSSQDLRRWPPVERETKRQD